MSQDNVHSRFMKQLRQGVAASITAAALLSGMSTGAAAAEPAPAEPTPSTAPASAPVATSHSGFASGYITTKEEYDNCQRKQQTPMKKLGQKLASNMTSPADRATATAELKALGETVKACQADVTARTNYSPRKP